MGEETDSKFRDTLQNSKNRNPVWSGGYYGKTTFLSSPSSDNGVGCTVSLMDTSPHESGFFQKNAEIPKNEKIPFQAPYLLGRQNHVYGEYGTTPNDAEFDTFGEKRKDQSTVNATSNDAEFDIFGEKKKDQSVHVRCVNTQRNSDTETGENEVKPHQQANCGLKSEGYTSAIEYCPNQKRITTLQTSLGELRRIGTLDGAMWTEKEPKFPCHLVVPDVQSGDASISESMSPVPTSSKNNEINECHNGSIPLNPFLLVEIIASESDRRRVATSLNCHLINGDPPKFYMQVIKEYGFDHIIIIGHCCYGFVFLDCFGRAFEWDSMTLALWSLGDYLDLSTKKSQTSNMVWLMETDGTIVEFEEEPLKQNDTYPVVKKDKKKNSKKKNLKKKHR